MLFSYWFGRAATSTSLRSQLRRGRTSLASSPESCESRLLLSTQNFAPILDPAGQPTLTSIPQNIATASNIGTAVSQIIANLTSTGGGISDPDSGAEQGLAITKVDNTYGNWQFTTDNGNHWTDFGNPTASVARLLASASGTKIRFVPDLGFHGSSTFIFVAWDQTTGTTGGTGVATNRGGSKPFSLGYDQAVISVINPNHAPVLGEFGFPTLTPITVNIPAASNPGTSVAQILTNFTNTLGRITDADPGALKGIALTRVDQTNGTWQFSTNNGATWTNFGTPSASVARLLASDADTRIRFLPNADFLGKATFIFVAWDQTEGTNGGTGIATNRGGSKPYSTAYTIGSIAVVPYLNYAPVLTWGRPTITPIVEDNTGSIGNLVSQMLASVPGLDMITDVDTAPLEGIAVYVVENTNGIWQFSTNNGSVWTDFGTPHPTTCRLLAADLTTRVRFVPNANFNGTSTFGFYAWDRTSGVNGDTANATTRGGATAFSAAAAGATITVTPVNDAPVLDNSGKPTLTSILKNETNTNGTLINDMLASVPGLNIITDVDAGALEGIAITTAGTTSGTWQYSTDNGTSWLALGAVSGSSARLLSANTNTRVRFVPNLDFTGNVTFTFCAWDRTTGANGDLANTSVRGGATAFSTALKTATLSVLPVLNHAPVLNASGNPKLPTFANGTENTGSLITDLIASMGPSGSITDSDPGALFGIAVIGANNTAGTWEYSLDNAAHWQEVGSMTLTSARLLAADANTRLRFVPSTTTFKGTVGIMFIAWDQTSGTNGSLVNASVNGGTTEFSTAKDDAFVAVT